MSQHDFGMQKTIRKSIKIVGKGLHTGKDVCMEIFGAPANHGITFLRTDLAHARPILAHAENVSSTELSTTIGFEGNTVSTVEHFLAATSGLGIDNLQIRLNGEELPILDGSSKLFVDALKDAEITALDRPRRYFVVRKPFEIHYGEKWLRIEPSNSMRFQCTIDFAHTLIGKQTFALDLRLDSFERIANARTFCQLKEVDYMRSVGLALGGSLENAVVIDGHRIVNEEGLRSENEFVAHKLLDCLGDFALLGAPFLGSVTSFKSGHQTHVNFIQELLKNREEYLAEVESLPITEHLSNNRHLPSKSAQFSYASAFNSGFAPTT